MDQKPNVKDVKILETVEDIQERREQVIILELHFLFQFINYIFLYKLFNFWFYCLGSQEICGVQGGCSQQAGNAWRFQEIPIFQVEFPELFTKETIKPPRESP